MLLSLVFPSVLVSSAHGATVVVQPTPGSLAAAIEVASDGDVLQLMPGDYPAVSISGGNSLTIEGAVAGGGGGDVVLGGVWVSGGMLTVRRVVFADAREAIKAEAAAVLVEDSTFRDVGSPQTPAISAKAGATLALLNVTAERIKGPQGAVSVTSDSVLGMQDVSISDCEGGAAGAIYAAGASAILDRISISTCTGETGGGIAAMSGTISMSAVQIVDSSADLGGGLYIDGAEVTAADIDLQGNSASSGGHVHVESGSLTWRRGMLSMGSADVGGGVSVIEGDVSIHNVLWHRLSAVSGGGLSAVGGSTAIAYCVMATTQADVGAAIAASGGAVSVFASILTGSIGAEAIASTDAEAVSIQDVVLWDNPEGDWLGSVTAPIAIRFDPLFTDTIGGDWTLRAGSPGLDAAPGVDHDGTAADIGLFGGPDAATLPDEDGDGFVAGRDCDDRDALVNESEPDAWYDGVDTDCDGASDYDADGDGFDSESRVGGGDCDDFNADIWPGADEESDGVDSNCDGVDLVDADGDGFGYAADCRDDDPSIYPGAEEHWYDGTDTDCAGDDDFDQDGDGYVPERYAAAGEAADCDDRDPFVSPAAPEVAGDGIDNNCDGSDAPAADDGDDPVTELVGDDGSAPEAEADPYQRPDSLMTTSGCSSAGGLPAWSLAGMAFLMTMLRRRRRRRS